MHTIWTNGSRTGVYAPLKESTSTEVVIVGGGMAGIVSAYLLARSGKKVMVLERGTIGGDVTSMTTAFITQLIDTNASELVSLLGAQQAKIVMESGRAAIDTIQEIIEREHIACDFSRCSAYMYAHTEKQFHQLTVDYAAAQHLGLSPKLVPEGNLGFTNAGYLEVPDQAKFQPLAFLRAVAQAAVAHGARIFEHAEVVSVSEAGSVRVVLANGSVVQAEDVAITTHVPFNKPKAVRFKKAVYRSYVLEAQVPHTDLKEGIYWDCANPYTYFRVDRQEGGARIMLGGADHRADIPFSAARNMSVLEHRLKEIVSGNPFTIVNRWHGPIIESVDGLPFIGAYAPHRYLATAFSGNGMTYAVITGLLLGDLTSGHSNHWVGIYSPQRKMSLRRLARKAPHYVREFFGGLINAITDR